MRVDEFDFDLPMELVAQHPVEPRDAARMLYVSRTGFKNRIFRDLPGILRPGDLLVFNNTRVIPARLKGTRGNASIEVTLHDPVGSGIWKAFARPAKRLREGDTILFAADLEARVTGKGAAGEVTLDFDRTDEVLISALHEHGAMPLPPYIKRPEFSRQDLEDYQPIFARHEGAVAAPTASLHFTESVLASLADREIAHAFLTLHVGAGTFLPVKTETVEAHTMHAERGEINKETADIINQTRQHGGRIVAVGSTALRLLETAADDTGGVSAWQGKTDIFITPGYRFKVADMMVTNFHLPKSTLFMLVSAFSGCARMKAAYRHAIDSGYRFYSYGDCCLLERLEDD